LSVSMKIGITEAGQCSINVGLIAFYLVCAQGTQGKYSII
jgi:hypothetical protein